jgi:hypothetical protein
LGGEKFHLLGSTIAPDQQSSTFFADTWPVALCAVITAALDYAAGG